MLLACFNVYQAFEFFRVCTCLCLRVFERILYGSRNWLVNLLKILVLHENPPKHGCPLTRVRRWGVEAGGYLAGATIQQRVCILRVSNAQHDKDLQFVWINICKQSCVSRRMDFSKMLILWANMKYHT